MDILRFITAGNVDDGKSTLIGRLLQDTDSIKSDILQSVQTTGSLAPNLAHITDGLRDERELGITIDVAYKYFTTLNRKYIITDAPGHFQYTRNLVTGASGVDAIIILIDANNGITDQTKRHSLVASFLKIPNIVVAINKMDMINYDQQTFIDHQLAFQLLAKQLALPSINYIPISALQGDNITTHSGNMAWYQGPTILEYLEGTNPNTIENAALRLSIQGSVNAGQANYLARVLSGTVQIGQALRTYPSGSSVMPQYMHLGFEKIETANTNQNITINLGDDAILDRGDIISNESDPPAYGCNIEALVCWLDDTQALSEGMEFYLRIHAAETSCIITKVVHTININTLLPNETKQTVAVNEFALVHVTTNKPIAYDRFQDIPSTGRGILINKKSNYTCAAFTII